MPVMFHITCCGFHSVIRCIKIENKENGGGEETELEEQGEKEKILSS